MASNIVGSATGAVWSFTTAQDEVRFASGGFSVAEDGQLTFSASSLLGNAALEVERRGELGLQVRLRGV